MDYGERERRQISFYSYSLSFTLVLTGWIGAGLLAGGNEGNNAQLEDGGTAGNGDDDVQQGEEGEGGGGEGRVKSVGAGQGHARVSSSSSSLSFSPSYSYYSVATASTLRSV